ncbi:MAG: hypothetical protein AAF355_11890 [Myxococcota bacterium]
MLDVSPFAGKLGTPLFPQHIETLSNILEEAHFDQPRLLSCFERLGTGFPPVESDKRIVEWILRTLGDLHTPLQITTAVFALMKIGVFKHRRFCKGGTQHWILPYYLRTIDYFSLIRNKSIGLENGNKPNANDHLVLLMMDGLVGEYFIGLFRAPGRPFWSSTFSNWRHDHDKHYEKYPRTFDTQNPLYVAPGSLT